jgi:hypothetical protein
MPRLLAEETRLNEEARRERNWSRWGTYLAERQWATVREDYSADGDCWRYFPHDHARSRVYRWGEDGLLGTCDRQCRLCFSVALWNGKDPILKERTFGLTSEEGNHGEDVKELYFYLDATPTTSYARALYKYPQAAFPYHELVAGNGQRNRRQPELEALDTGVYDDGHWDVTVEYAKAAPEDILVRITVKNHGPATAELEVLPQLWFRNTWAWGRTGEGYAPRPQLAQAELAGAAASIAGSHQELGRYELLLGAGQGGAIPELLFTENDTNSERLYGSPAPTPYTKDAFHRHVCDGEAGAVNPARVGTKACARYRLRVAAGGEHTLVMRLRAPGGDCDHAVLDLPLGPSFGATFDERRAEADAFHAARTPSAATAEEARVMRQARAGLLWTRQFYWLDVKTWLEGDPAQPPPPPGRTRNRDFADHLYNRDVLSMPDKWEYPWYAAWDLAFHMIPMAEVDPEFAKAQLILLLREWYMTPAGQLPAYEFAFGDVNPPVHAWAAWRVYKLTGARGARDQVFLARIFQKLLLNFTWWVNQKDHDGNHIFSGGFLGLDNIGVFDRSKPLPTGGTLEQADGTAWMAFYASNMLSMAFELAETNPAAEDMASKFFEHFIAIAGAMNGLGGTGLWDEEDGFYYDQLHISTASGPRFEPLRIRSIVGLIPLLTAQVLPEDVLSRMTGFKKRMDWLFANRPHLAATITWMAAPQHEWGGHRLLAIPSRQRLERTLRLMFDEKEFLSPYGVRSLSLVHKDKPFVTHAGGQEYRVDYVPGDSTTGMFGGNSNWRGPIWLPINYLLIEALERYHFFYGDTLKIECPTGSGHWVNLRQAALELCRRLSRLFLTNDEGQVPGFGAQAARFATDPAFHDLSLFHEYFNPDTGTGHGAEHQTGWTALIVRCLERLARAR